MTDVRAIPVSREQRDGLAGGTIGAVDRWLEVERHLISAFDAAGNQPRIRWCVEHGRRSLLEEDNVEACGLWTDDNPCRVVDAIVVPLEAAS